MTRKKIAILILGLILFACLLACGYFGAKTVRRTYQRRTAMAAYEKKDYEEAERLLLAYVMKDSNSEPEYAALANIYHEFGNIGMEAEMWQMASSLNPLKSEYHENMLNAAQASANYSLLYSIIGRKAIIDEKFDDRELFLYLIAACRTGHQKEAEDLHKKYHDKDASIFQKSELGRLAEFMVTYTSVPDAKRSDFLEQMLKSEDPSIRFEALYSTIRLQLSRIAKGGAEDAGTTIEDLMKQLAAINYYAGTPVLADYYFTLSRFGDVTKVLTPYLKTIDNMTMYLMFLECCTLEGRLDILKETVERFHKKGIRFKVLADYCGILISYLEKDKVTLAERVRKSGKTISSPLALFIRLQVALDAKSYNEIHAAATEFFASPPLGNLRNQAVMACVDYITEQMQKRENQADLTQMAALSQILAPHVESSRLLTTIILADQHKKGLVKEADLLEALAQYPESFLLTQTAAEYMILNGKAEQALPLIERLQNAEEEDDDNETNNSALFLKTLALDQLGRTDEAAEVFQKLIEHSQFDTGLLTRYFQFCVAAKREKDLNAMADKLDTAQDGKLKQYSVFFRAAALLLTEDEGKRNDALKKLAATSNDNPDFAFYAATRLSEFDWLDDAEKKYKALLGTYSNPLLIYANLSEIYKAKGDSEKAIEAAKEGFEKTHSQLSAFVYAKRLSDAKCFEEAVDILNFPRRAVNYREDVVALWADCMHHVIENSIAGERYMHAEEQCKHLLIIAPDDAFGKENLEKVQKIIKQQNNKGQSEETVPAA